MSKDNIFFSKFERTQSRGATVLSPNSLSRRTQCRKTTVFSLNCSGRTQCRGATVLSPNLFSGRTQCRKTTVFSPSSGNRIVVGQLFFHQIPANAMSWGNRSCTKLYGALNGSHFYRYFRTVP
ncbi:uncharacterized protein [Atheta coriaria]|uniref:uncharacterized protein isoform X10 n=1 Tax=Dalotia coriaria TaxID=877792 RepID=UPI0031F3B5C6